jgi:uncharacterized protein (TIGR02001 family)
MRSIRLLMMSLMMASLSAGSVLAIEQDIEPIPELEAEAAAAASQQTILGQPFDVGLGLALTTDYVSRGITQSDSSLAIQGYIEPTIGMAYVNIWSSNVDFGGEGFRGAEIDTAIGIRPEFGPLSLDMGYVHYFYSPEDISPDYGEIFAKADYNFNDMVTFGARVFFAPDFSQTGNNATFVAAGLRVPLPHDFSVYGGVGYQFFEDPNAFEQLAWTAGVSYDWKAFTFDLRYWDTDLDDDECVVRSGFSDGCDARIVGTISLNTAWSALKEAGF